MSTVVLHPHTLRAIKKGHPWVTKDEFTRKFPNKEFFLFGSNSKRESQALLLHDPQHPLVKARVWTMSPPFTSKIEEFSKELRQRIFQAFERRIQNHWHQQRDNLYLVFGEADFLPGLYLLKLKKNFLIQCYAFFWEQRKSQLLEIFQAALKSYFLDFKNPVWWWEKRDGTSNINRTIIDGHDQDGGRPIISEFGLNYQLNLRDYQDVGIYTDMASIRQRLGPYWPKGGRVLNLYSYTGGYSLPALQHQAQEVISVDLSPAYLSWLEKNIRLNQNLDYRRHISMALPVHQAVDQLQLEKKSFELIICDPPSSSSDGHKKSSAIQQYTTLLPQLRQLLSPGGKMLIFLNTHHVSRGTFEGKVRQILKNSRNEETFQLSDDCPTLQSFPEGNYLKGILLGE
jgi:23S rRNA (cytosine1962-C5)-methyltransferase